MKNQNYSNDSHGHGHDHSDDHDHDHDHSTQTAKSLFQLFLPAIISGSLLLAGLGVDYLLKPHWFSGWFRILWYLAAYLPVGTPVIKEAWQSFRHSDFFSEFLLMTIATVGAFGIAEYPEAVAVMLFYSVGEAFQGMAVQRARKNIKNLLDSRPDEVTVLEKGIPKTINAEIVEIGQVIQLKPGEKLALDGELLSEMASFNTSALTGESKPNSKKKGDPIFAGMINLNRAAEIKVTALYADSKLAKILDLVQNATSQKAPTELFIRKFAKIYTPIVVFLALGIVFIPYFFDEFYTFQKWLYRALVFLVISCPCALVISIPLGYFGGIGAASKNGILIKGSNFLDILAKIQHVVLDKTGTLTQGVFEVQDIFIKNEFNQDQILQYLNLLESKSTHPIATAIHNFVGKPDHSLKLENTEEIAGHGLRGFIEGKEMLAGNFKLMEKFGVQHQIDHQQVSDTVVAIALDRKLVGYLTISDKIKADAAQTIKKLNDQNVKTTMLSGDKTAVVREVAKIVGISQFFGDLLPEDKVTKVKEIKAKDQWVAFVGDGVNDAPVVAISDVGIAMGGLGSDATIETADVVIQDDKPSKMPVAIRIGKETRKIVWQNIILAFVVKAAVLILGAGGVATMWEAVFADVGVALLAVLNAVRIQNMNLND